MSQAPEDAPAEPPASDAEPAAATGSAPSVPAAGVAEPLATVRATSATNTLDYWHNGIALAVFGLVMFGAAAAPLWSEVDWLWPTLFALWLLGTVIDVLLLARRNRAFRCELHADFVWLRKGLLFVTADTVPIERVVAVGETSGPLTRSFGLTTVELHATTEKFKTLAVAREDAEALIDRIRSEIARRHPVAAD